MNLTLKDFVPSDVCLACDGCCRFQEKTSVWRPKIALEEIDSPEKKEIFSADAVDKYHQLTTVCSGDHHFCRFLDRKTNECTIYSLRPFECALYPFILSREDNRPAIFVHHHCPFVQEKRGNQEFADYVVYLKSFFQTQNAQGFLERNTILISQYPATKEELEFLFHVD